MHPQRHARASTSPTRCKNPEPFQMVFPHVIGFFFPIIVFPSAGFAP